MHIRKVRIKNVRSIRELTWAPAGPLPGWHIVLGDNGSGKSSFLKSICLALVGTSDAGALRQAWDDWLTIGKETGSIKLDIGWDGNVDQFSGKGKLPAATASLPVEVDFRRNQKGDPSHVELLANVTGTDPKRHVWNGSGGWFSASYGPFRRFSGGDANSEKLFYSMPRLSRHLSLFDERIALTECLEWLRTLKFKKLERDSEGDLLEDVKTFLNQSDFLPSGVTLHNVTSKAVLFKDANGVNVGVEDLSDGYRSVLSMTFELMRQLSIAFGPDQVFSRTDPGVVQPSGVVVIDEVDAHLHPNWQRNIGRWFTKHFPNIQFIVSTHSPLVCQSAENGTIFVLPRAGSTDDAEFVDEAAFKRLVYGNVLDAYGTEAFGREAALTRSKISRDKHQKLAELNNKEILKGLTAAEKMQQRELRAMLPTAAADLG